MSNVMTGDYAGQATKARAPGELEVLASRIQDIATTTRKLRDSLRDLADRVLGQEPREIDERKEGGAAVPHPVLPPIQVMSRELEQTAVTFSDVWRQIERLESL